MVLGRQADIVYLLIISVIIMIKASFPLSISLARILPSYSHHWHKMKTVLHAALLSVGIEIHKHKIMLFKTKKGRFFILLLLAL